MFVERANASPKRSSAPEGFSLHRTWYYHYKKPRCSSSVRDARRPSEIFNTRRAPPGASPTASRPSPSGRSTAFPHPCKTSPTATPPRLSTTARARRRDRTRVSTTARAPRDVPRDVELDVALARRRRRRRGLIPPTQLRHQSSVVGNRGGGGLIFGVRDVLSRGWSVDGGVERGGPRVALAFRVGDEELTPSLLRLGASDEFHAVRASRFRARGGARGRDVGDVENAAGLRRGGDVVGLEPREFAILEHEPPPTPRRQVFPLLRQPPAVRGSLVPAHSRRRLCD